jgi:hypothetical protein
VTVSIDWSTAADNEAQLGFVEDVTHRHVAFIGGLGSGKTWSGATKTILYALSQPYSLLGVMAPTYRQLRDSTMREFFKLLPQELIASWNRSEYELKLKNGTEILFRSLENYDAIRGIEFALIWIDEANLVSHKAWKVAIGRLRQPGYPHRGIITTTPRGKTLNWLYEEFVEKPRKNPGLSRVSYHARTRDNIQNIGEAYIADLEASYTGEFAQQELMGEFIDIIEGRVYPEFERQYHVNFLEGEEILFQPHLPLYGFWDYGIGDHAALWVAQTALVPEHESVPYKNPDEDSEDEYIVRTVPASPGLVLIDLVLEEGENVDYWIETVKLIEDRWKPFDKHMGDPAGEQRTVTTGKSMAQHLREAGIFVRSKKLPNDEGRKAIVKLLVERRMFVSIDCELGATAFTNYHWPLDPDGNRKIGSRDPVHDWSSHPMDALRYGVTQLFPVYAPTPVREVSGGTSVFKGLRTTNRGSQAPRSSFRKETVW